ncbi:phosphoenolpyruvate synthase regulatory protein [Acidihalobacter yilgarnensis]|uniref:Putative phosphoenolpyruvate synthase regulatory protein n=1 Tax=Acidihalobacter yilgarnensis TaxID=2819280 RepID=A0A1D8ITM5_9GAMM|nr:pyruvate, water dikinase regulatory protein [Acidihalobacter yilgarnensis]AOU99839.1 phosphoenolpyruvate synthase regulatory protein [Acidihalobacter yilgarnensis]
MTKVRGAFFLSDRTGITSETLGNMLLTQFAGVQFERVTIPFINSAAKARGVVERIDAYRERHGEPPLIFSTAVDDEVRGILATADGVFMDFFESFIARLEDTLDVRASHSVGLAHGVNPGTYHRRIEAVNFALAHDDGARTDHYAEADVILLAPSRCGKTPTCLYLALQHGLRAANMPLTEEVLEAERLPASLLDYRSKLFGLTIDPVRLAQIRSERLPNSHYASREQCERELRLAQGIYRRLGAPSLDTTHVSVEEIAAHIIHQTGLKSILR